MVLQSIKQALQTGQAELALALCHNLEASESGNPIFYLYRGVAHTKLRQFIEAERDFLKCTELDVTLIAPHKNLAQIYKSQNPQKALRALLLASWIDPEDAGILKDLATHFSEHWHYPDADIVFYTGTPFLKGKLTPDQMDTRAIGGSETAFIMMATELAKLGKKILCFCNIATRLHHDGVDYIPVEEFFIYHHLHTIPVFISSRFLEPFKHPLNARKKILWLHENHGCAIDEDVSPYRNNIDFCLCLSDFHIKTLAQKFSLPRDFFRKTTNGFITRHFEKSYPQKDRFSLIYMSRPVRGLREALDILAQLKPRFPETRLHVCSYTELSNLEADPEFAEVWPRLKEDGVVFHGGLSKPELARLLGKTEIMLYPNVRHHETSCMAAMEAMAAGVVPVTTDCGALPETVPHGIGGVIVPFTENRDELMSQFVEEITTLFENGERLSTLSRGARKFAWEHYPWCKVAREWTKF